MSDLLDSQLEVHVGRRPLGDGRVMNCFSIPHGYLEAAYTESIGQFTIANLDVDPKHRRQGIGKELLRAALREAQELKARYVIAGIISRECLLAMQSVFPAESIHVEHEGTFLADTGDPEQSFDTTAHLYHRLTEDAPLTQPEP